MITTAELAPRCALSDPGLPAAIVGLLSARRHFSADPTLGVVALSADLCLLSLDDQRVPAELPADLSIVGAACIELEIFDLLALGAEGLRDAHRRRRDALTARVRAIARSGTSQAPIDRAVNVGLGLCLLRAVAHEVGADVRDQVDRELDEVVVWLLDQAPTSAVGQAEGGAA